MSAQPLRQAAREGRPLALSHNLVGQRLGRKGLETRERILSAALRLLEGPGEAAVTLSGVAREAAVGMTTLYLYFPDLGDLVLAALSRVMDSGGAAFLDRLRVRWPDDALDSSCLEFLRAHHQFWRKHSRLLHMRNSLADACDVRFLEYRNRVSLPLIGLLVAQMDGRPDDLRDRRFLLATVLLTGFERLATIVTNPSFQVAMQEMDGETYVARLLEVEAGLIAGAIRTSRSEAAIPEIRCAS